MKIYDCIKWYWPNGRTFRTKIQKSNVGLSFVSQLIFPVGARWESSTRTPMSREMNACPWQTQCFTDQSMNWLLVHTLLTQSSFCFSCAIRIMMHRKYLGMIRKQPRPVGSRAAPLTHSYNSFIFSSSRKVLLRVWLLHNVCM